MNQQDDDNYVNLVALPIEEQRGLTKEEQLAAIDKAFSLKNGSKEKDYFTAHPLTTDVIGRGYPATEQEIESIRLVNAEEQRLLKEDSNIKPNEEGYNYYIIEDGRIFKSRNDVICFGLDFSDMTWKENPIYMSIMYDTCLKYSKLYNFRDYYKIVENEKTM